MPQRQVPPPSSPKLLAEMFLTYGLSKGFRPKFSGIPVPPSLSLLIFCFLVWRVLPTNNLRFSLLLLPTSGSPIMTLGPLCILPVTTPIFLSYNIAQYWTMRSRVRNSLRFLQVALWSPHRSSWDCLLFPNGASFTSPGSSFFSLLIEEGRIEPIKSPALYDLWPGSQKIFVVWYPKNWEPICLTKDVALKEIKMLQIAYVEKSLCVSPIICVNGVNRLSQGSLNVSG